MSFQKEQSINRNLIKNHMIKLDLDNPKKDYDQLIEAIGNAQVVLIGEASHGTEEFYHERCLITKRLIKEKDFTVVACEADWPDTYKVNRYVQNFKSNDSKDAREALSDFKRFPTWMWRNYQIADFVEWLKKHNDELEAKAKAEQGEEEWNRYNKTGIYGLDLYSLFASIDAVITYLENVDARAAKRARQAYGCFDHFDRSTESYAFSTYFKVSSSCEKEVIRVLTDLAKKQSERITRKNHSNDEDVDELFCANINAMVVKDAEEYYRKMINAGAQSWNMRDSHMMETLKSLINFFQRQRTKQVKAVVWAHNSHVGDARQTHQGENQKELNIGQLVREQFGFDRVYNIGFTTHTGTVTAASDWNGPRDKKAVNPSRRETVEHLFHTVAEETSSPNFLLTFNQIKQNKKLPVSKDLMNELANKARLKERAIGVIYRPDTELRSHYFNAKISLQFDAVIHIDTTSALKPLPDKTEDEIDRTNIKEEEMPETYPTGE
ncbi:9622_t:CDS:10 [Funneliformis caledonium]|uniref:9622_t:CDS:1 n=1 Tax=Funneliformis caledonium TaxID=1117310 RepID=A0A9N8YR38_9GLOM|nr:9622_t:CDS:10 [Funneliformis caledonium]